MKEVTLADQVMDSLAFEVEEVPQDGQISSVSSNSPLNVKIRIRKKNRKQLIDGGIISIPKIDNAAYDGEKIRVASSDQTIMSFNVLMERGQTLKKRPPKQKRILQLFKRGGCLGIQNDDDQYEYSQGTSQPDKENKLLEATEGLTSDGLNKPNFALAKNYSNTEASQAGKQKHTDFLGKCKPGGCLDPPFGEDKYSYLPKFIDVAVEDQNETNAKINECECKETPDLNNANIKKDEDKTSFSPEVDKEKTEPPHDSDTSLLQIKNSNSIITFPSISPSSEALNKLRIQRRSKSYSSSRESRSYNESNQLLETYFISPKVKTIDQKPKSITDSEALINTENVDTSTLKSEGNLFGETKFEAQIDSNLGTDKNLDSADKIDLCLTKNELIPNYISDVTRADEPALLKKHEINTESTPKDRPTTISIKPDSNQLSINDSVINPEIWFNEQQVKSDREYMDKGDTIPVENLQGIENGTETNSILSHDFKVDKTDRQLNKGTSEVLLNEIFQGKLKTLPKSAENDSIKIKNNIDINSSLPDNIINNESLNLIDEETKVSPEQIKQPITKMLTKSLESIIIKNTSAETMNAPTRDHYIDEDLIMKDDAPKISSLIEKQKEDTSNLDIISFTKNIEDDGTMDEHSINTNLLLPQSSPIFNEALTTIKNAMRISSPEETMSFKEVTNSTKNENVEAVVSLQSPLHDEGALKKVETVADTPLQDGDQDITFLSKSSQDKVNDEHQNKFEEHAEDSIKTSVQSSTEVISYEELKNNASLISPKETKMDSNNSNSITNLNFQDVKEERDKEILQSFHTIKSDLIKPDQLALQDNQDASVFNPDINAEKVKEDKDKEKLESFHTIKSDFIKPDQVVLQGDQDASVFNPDINAKKVSDLHVDVNSVLGHINSGNSITESQKAENSSNIKGGILHDQNFHKDLEVTFSDKLITEKFESVNILSKPTDGVESFNPVKEDKDKEKLGSFHTVKSDFIKPDQVALQGDQDASLFNPDINAEKVSELHVDVNSVLGHINSGNSITESQKAENSTNIKGGILHDQNFHKDLEVTFSDKLITERFGSVNILGKPADGVETRMEIELNQSGHGVWNSNDNFNKMGTIPSDNGSISTKKDTHLKHSLSKSYDEKETIQINMAFQSFQTDEDGNVIKTLDSSSYNDSKRYPNDNILQFKTIIRPNDGMIKIPIDSDKDLILQIKTNQKYGDQRDGLIKNLPDLNNQISSQDKSNIFDEDYDRGNLFPSNDLALQNNASTITKNLLNGKKSNDINLQQTLDEVYKDKLLPLHDIIKKLKSDIEELSKQQILIKEKLYNTKRVQSNPTYVSGKKCGCIEMLFSR